MASAEGVYRRLLVAYPREYRREHQAEILTTLVEAAEPGRRRPSLREARGLLVGGLRTRALLAARQGGRTLLADGIRMAVILLLGVRISRFVGLLPPAYASFVPLVMWIAAPLLTLALVAVVRGAIRSGLVLVLLGGVASMPWSLTSRSFFGGLGPAGPTSSQTGVLILVAALLVGLTSMQRVQRPWSWWLAVAVIMGPRLNVSAHQWYFQYVAARLDEVHSQYFSAALNFLDSLVSVAVPAALIALTMIARDPRPSIAAAVFAGAGLLANLYASVATGIEWHGYPWSLLPGYLVEPTLIITVSVITVAATRDTSIPVRSHPQNHENTNMKTRRGLAASVLVAVGLCACGTTMSGLSAHAPAAPSCPMSTTGPSPRATSSTALNLVKYEVPGPNPAMQHIVTGPDGNLWFTGGTVDTDVVGRITPSGTITLYHPPTKRSGPYGITAGPDGNIWFTEAGKIGRLVPSTGRIDEFALPHPSTSSTPPPTNGVSTLYGPGDIVSGPDGNLWFAVEKPAYPPQTADGFVGRITPAGAITLFAVPRGQPISIQVGADGNLWSRLTTSTPCNPSELSSMLVRVTPAGDVAEVSEDSPQFGGYVVGPDGNNWWLTSTGTMRRTTPSGHVTEFATELPPGFDAPEFYQFVFGPDRNIWYAAGGPGIYRMTLTGNLSRYEAPPMSAPFGITVGPDGRLWFVDLSSAVHPIVGAFRPPVQ